MGFSWFVSAPLASYPRSWLYSFMSPRSKSYGYVVPELDVKPRNARIEVCNGGEQCHQGNRVAQPVTTGNFGLMSPVDTYLNHREMLYMSLTHKWTEGLLKSELLAEIQFLFSAPG